MRSELVASVDVNGTVAHALNCDTDGSIHIDLTRGQFPNMKDEIIVENELPPEIIPSGTGMSFETFKAIRDETIQRLVQRLEMAGALPHGL